MAVQHDAPVDFPRVLKEEELFAGPPADMLALSREKPVWPLRHTDGSFGWLVFDLPRAHTVLNDPRFSMLPAGFAIGDGGFGEAAEELENPGDLLRLDPPRHTSVRKTLTAFFTVRAIGELRPAVEKIVDGQIDAMQVAGPPVDFVEQFSRQVPAMTICSMLGVPFSDGPRFIEPSQVLMGGDSTTVEEKKAALDEFYAYVRGVLAAKRAEPGDDLITKLLERGQLTNDELAGVVWFLFSAGFETTAQTLAITAFYLLYEPGRWEATRENGAPIEKLVEELFRYVPVFRSGMPQRTALADIDLDGYLVRAGEHVTVYQTVAHHDPERYPDPDLFDPTRDSRGHLLFGFGRHMCLGQHLARLEVQVAMERLFERMPTLRLAVPPGEVGLIRTGWLHGIVTELPVAW
jgi:cytochrome P450